MAPLNFGVRLVCTGKRTPPAGNGAQRRWAVYARLESFHKTRHRGTRTRREKTAITMTTIPPV